MLKAFTAAAAIAALLTIAVDAQDKKPDGPPPGRGGLSIVNDDPFRAPTSPSRRGRSSSATSTSSPPPDR